MNKITSTGLLALALMIFGTMNSYATSYAEPEVKTIKSENGKYTLITNPTTKTHKIYASNDLKKALWSFELKMWHFPIHLSNDGKTVCHLAWRHVQEDELKENCVTFRNAKGIFKTYSFKDICPNPPKTQDVGVGPIGDSWRTWFNASSCKDDTLHVTTILNTTYIFSMKDGSLQGTITSGREMDPR